MKWEYLSLTFDSKGGFIRTATVDPKSVDEQLNTLGEQGWELVSMVGIQDVRGHTETVFATLKRPKHGA